MFLIINNHSSAFISIVSSMLTISSCFLKNIFFGFSFFWNSRFSRNFPFFFWKIWFFENFHFLKNVIGLFFHEKKVFSWKFSVFLFLWYLIPKLSNVELLTPPHTLLVTVYVSGIFSKIRKIQEIFQTVPSDLEFPWYLSIKKSNAI